MQLMAEQFLREIYVPMVPPLQTWNVRCEGRDGLSWSSAGGHLALVLCNAAAVGVRPATVRDDVTWEEISLRNQSNTTSFRE